MHQNHSLVDVSIVTSETLKIIIVSIYLGNQNGSGSEQRKFENAGGLQLATHLPTASLLLPVQVLLSISAHFAEIGSTLPGQCTVKFFFFSICSSSLTQECRWRNGGIPTKRGVCLVECLYSVDWVHCGDDDVLLLVTISGAW